MNPMSMKAAFSSWNRRIAPVFDVARHLVLIEVESGRIVSETDGTLPADDLGEKVRLLAGFGVNVLVCGAVSRFLHGLVASYGITVVPFVAGDLREIIQAWLDDRLDERYAMPGCCSRTRRKTLRGRRPGQRDPFRDASPGDGLHHRTGLGTGLGQPVRGFGEGLAAVENPGSCICPRCGCIEVNQAGIPCLHMRCPRCGSMMVKES